MGTRSAIRTVVGAFALASFAVGLPSRAGAQCDDKQLQKITVGPVSGFGASLALVGNTAVVSNPGAAVHLFERMAGGQFQSVSVITAPVGPWRAGFGESVDISGDRVAIGFPSELGSGGQPNVGAVWLVERVGGTWNSASPLTSPASGPQQAFGKGVALDGNLLCATRFPPLSTSVVDVFEFSGGTWNYITTFAPPGLPTNAQFGESLDADGVRIAATCPGEIGFGGNHGSVRIFEKTGGAWTEVAKLVPSVSGGFSFGRSISLRGDRLLVSGTIYPVAGSSVPAAFVFERVAPFWVQTAVLTSAAAAPSADFGRTVALGDDVACISAPNEQIGSDISGAAYVFTRAAGVWTERIRLVANDPTLCRGLGYDAALSGQEVLLGAPNSFGSPSGSLGAAYLFSTVPNPAPEYGAACPGSGGFLPSLSLKATFDGCFAAGDGVSFDIKGGLGGSTCLLLLGLSTAAAPLPGGCSLLLAPTQANVVLPLFGAGPGAGAISFSSTIPAGFPALSVYLQGFVVDPGVARGFSATNGLRMTVK